MPSDINVLCEGILAMTEFVQYDSSFGQKILYTPCAKVTNILSSSTQKLIKRMQTAVQGKGIGLAANQIGYGVQIFLITYDPEPTSPAHTRRYQLDWEPIPMQVFINPRIISASPECISFWHGCLSAESRDRGKVATYAWLTYEAYNERAEKITGKLAGLGAIIFQHEFRHLLGSLYCDHALEFKPFSPLAEELAQGKLQLYAPADASVPHLLSDYRVGETIEDYAARRREEK